LVREEYPAASTTGHRWNQPFSLTSCSESGDQMKKRVLLVIWTARRNRESIIRANTTNDGTFIWLVDAGNKIRRLTRT
jgi:hypothetical protein